MINLYELVDSTNGQLLGVPAAQLFDSFTIDADRSASGQMFVVTTTIYGDTHHLIAKAIANGVTGVICNRPPTCDTSGVSVVLVDNTVDALMAWSQYVLGRYGTKVIGVVGMGGRSVTAYVISRILRLSGKTHYEPDRGYGRLSVPFALASLKPSDKFAVLTLDLSDVGDMAVLAQATQPESVVVTRINTDYPMNFSSVQQLADEIHILTDLLPSTGLVVLNDDDDDVRALAATVRAQVKTYSTANFGADLMAYNMRSLLDGTQFDLRLGSERFYNIDTPLFSTDYISCLLSAILIGLNYGVSLTDCLDVVKTINPLQGRLYPLKGKGKARLIDATAGEYTLGALNWLDAVRKKINGRLFFLLGDLGDRHHKIYQRIGKRAQAVVDVFITQGSRSADAGLLAIKHGLSPDNVWMVATPEDVLTVMNERYQLTKDDLVLVAGNPLSGMGEVTEALLANPDDKRYLPHSVSRFNQRLLSHPARLTWIDVDYGAIANNIRCLKAWVGDHVRLMAVVKSDAYGHGAVMTARTALVNGASYLGVSSLQEALVLREAGIRAPIFALNYVPPYMARQAIQHDITLSGFDLETVRAYDRAALELGKKATIHIKIDTGIGRLGVLLDESLSFVRHVMGLANITVEGIYTHFSMGDSTSHDYTATQLQRWNKVIRNLNHHGYHFPLIHTCNSGGTIAYPEGHFDMVRTGIAMYGMHPSDEVLLPEGFQPAMTWKTLVAQVKTLPAGHTVGYGNTYITQKPETIAVLPVGYADGFRRAPENFGEVLIHGQRAPIIGRVSMEKTVINVSHIPNVMAGDEVVILGRQGDETITAEEIGKQIGSLNYEVTCNALARIPR
jgi:alanine racemase